jgi:uncharacterized Zn-binding protein involved in type VI secretion
MEIAMDKTIEDNLREMAEFQARLARRPVKGCYSLATLGSRTECGGEVVSASTTMNSCGHRIACVGDVVRYPDGRETTIRSGAGAALSFRGQPMALIGSFTANGDMIVSSLQNPARIRDFTDTGIPGLFQAGYVAPCGAADIVSGTV